MQIRLSITSRRASLNSTSLENDQPREKVQIWPVIEDLMKKSYSFLYDNSFIAAHICMMVKSLESIRKQISVSWVSFQIWSISYHCWFAFIYLLWSIITWTLPNQKEFLLKSSPYLVLYSSIMLLLTYFCSMDILQDIPVMVSQMKLRWKKFNII